MCEQKACFGDMFPDLDRLRYNKPLEGRALAVMVENRGIAVSSRRVIVKPEGWDACTACEHYRNCYDLGMARLLLGVALEQRM